MTRDLYSPALTTSEVGAPADGEKIFGGGEMATRIREYAWGATALAPIGAWPESLLCTVNMILASRFPIIVLWGSDFIQLYNDSYIPLIAEKHPRNLGAPSAETWGEAWHVIGPQLRAVLLNGQSIYRSNILVPITRDGHLRDVYWTYSNHSYLSTRIGSTLAARCAGKKHAASATNARSNPTQTYVSMSVGDTP